MVIKILSYVAATIGLIEIVTLLFELIGIKKRMTGEYYCNDCEVAFLSRGEIRYKYCPYCGQRLTKYVPKDEE